MKKWCVCCSQIFVIEEEEEEEENKESTRRNKDERKKAWKNERKCLSRLDTLYVTYALYFWLNVTVKPTEYT